MNMNEKEYIERTLESYKDKEYTKLDELKSLDKKAKRGAYIFAYVFGVIASLVLGFGMCVAMEVILAEYMWIGIIVGVAGIIMCVSNYFIYKVILKKGKAKYKDKINALSNELLNS